MASTAAGVAVGSSIGHALGGFFGGSGQANVESQAADGMVASQGQGETYQSTSYGKNCEADARSFTKCLDENKGNDHQMSICGWYLEQLVSFQSFYVDYGSLEDNVLISPNSFRKPASQLLANTRTWNCM
ncbi:hypothetical protein MMC18_009674 [Xylographa bjoerkii]|nr:hypothetical protein [Xylographa bjoerkii]